MHFNQTFLNYMYTISTEYTFSFNQIQFFDNINVM